MKPVESKQLRENFVPSFGKSSFDLQVPKLDPSMARRLKEVKGGEASKAEAKEKALVLASQFKILDSPSHSSIYGEAPLPRPLPTRLGTSLFLSALPSRLFNYGGMPSTASRSREERMCYARLTTVSSLTWQRQVDSSRENVDSSLAVPFLKVWSEMRQMTRS